MSMHATQSTLLTMGLDAASAHPELVVDTKNITNSMKRNFDTVAARRAFGRSDVLAMAHLSKAMGRLAQKGIYLPMTKEMLEGEIKATASIKELQEADNDIGRLSLTPMGEFSYQRKEIAEGEDLQANIPSYNYNQGVLTKLKKRIHRMGKRHAAQVKGDVKAIAKEKMALEEEFSKIIGELVEGNYYLDNRDGGDDGDNGDNGGGGGGSGGGGGGNPPPPKKPKFNSSAPKGFAVPGLNLGGSVSTGGLGAPPNGGGDSKPGTGGGGAGGSIITQTGTPANDPMIVDPGQPKLNTMNIVASDDTTPQPMPFKKYGKRSSADTMSRQNAQFVDQSNTPPPQNTTGIPLRPSGFFANFFQNRQGIIPQQTTDQDINLSGKGTGAPANLNNTTNTTVNMTNNSQANEPFRSSRAFSTPASSGIEEILANEAVQKFNVIRENQNKAPVIASGRGLIAENTTQRSETANTGPEAVPTTRNYINPSLLNNQTIVTPDSMLDIDPTPKPVPYIDSETEKWFAQRLNMGLNVPDFADKSSANFLLSKDKSKWVNPEKIVRTGGFIFNENSQGLGLLSPKEHNFSPEFDDYMGKISVYNRNDVNKVKSAFLAAIEYIRRIHHKSLMERATKELKPEEGKSMLLNISRDIISSLQDAYDRDPDNTTSRYAGSAGYKKSLANTLARIANNFDIDFQDARLLLVETIKNLEVMTQQKAKNKK